MIVSSNSNLFQKRATPVSAPRLPMFRALRHRNYRLYFAGQIIALSGTWLQTVVQGWLVFDLTHSTFWLGLVGFLNFLPLSFFISMPTAHCNGACRIICAAA